MIWKECSSSYAVSDTGLVRRIKPSSSRHGGTSLGRCLSLSNGVKYHQVSLWENGVSRRAYVHALVAAAFIGPREGKLEVNHKDGDKHNNRVSNLEYVTRIQNERHKREVLGKHSRGEMCPTAKLTWKIVNEIRRIGGSFTQKLIASRYGVSQVLISQILLKKIWKEDI